MPRKHKSQPRPARKPLTYADIDAITNPFIGWSKAPGDPLKFTEPPKETVLGYVEAWRWWIPKIVSDGDDIHPASNNTEYTWSWDGENIATEPPTFDNSHGFYAYKLAGIEDHQNALFGRVALYGDVVYCKYGYRAEKARILDVWVDKEHAREYPATWAQLQSIPQVKGVFDTSDARIYRSDGEREDYQCLTLEHLKELSGTSLSDGPTISPCQQSNQTELLIDLRSNLWERLNRNPFMFAPMSMPTLKSPYSEKEWIIRPDGDMCFYCGRLITNNEPVALEFVFPNGDLRQLINEQRFKWDRKRHHLSCAAEAMTQPAILNGTWEDLDGPSYATNVTMGNPYQFRFTGWKTI